MVDTTSSVRLVSCAGFAALALSWAAPPALAQPTWRLTAAAVNISGNALADEGCGPAVAFDALNVVRFTQQQNGDYLARVPIWVEDSSPCPPDGPSFAYSDAVVLVRLSGDGTRRLVLTWNLISKSTTKAIEGFVGQSISSLAASLSADVNYAAGQPVFVDWDWRNLSALETRTEAFECFAFGPPPPGEAPPDAGAVSCRFNLFGVERFGARFDAFPPPGIDFVSLHKETDAGQFIAMGGDTFGAAVSGDGFENVHFAGEFAHCGHDYGLARFKGQLVLTLSAVGQPDPPLPPLCDEPVFEFSVDIGSDAELSDPNRTGNEMLDPGDAYTAFTPALLSPEDGVFDDESIFPVLLGGAGDPSPDDDNGTLAPVCNGAAVSGNARVAFDLDAYDTVDGTTLLSLIDPTAPRSEPAPAFDSSSIHVLEHLVLSLDDDGPAAIGACDLPMNTALPNGNLAHGGTLERDELIGLDVHPANPMVTASKPYPICDEATLHRNLAPNPDARIEDDDDVDALDIYPRSVPVVLRLFSVDHEAGRDNRTAVGRGVLDPGDVFTMLPGAAAPTRVVDDVIHLGIPNTTDVDAIEFVFFDEEAVNPTTPVLALLFSVSADDPATAPDESGGMDPGQVYYSFLDGISRPLLDAPLDEDIDALATWCDDFLDGPPRPRCPCDFNGDGVLDSQDYFDFLNGFFSGAADFNGDGVTDSQDYFDFLTCFFNGCP